MKILTVSGLYPPDYLGGYELACAEVINALRNRGHEVHILTSPRRPNTGSLSPDDHWTHRIFDFAPLSQTQSENIVTRAIKEWRNDRQCRRWVESVRPDIISVWDMWGLLPGILTILERTGIAVTYAISSPWVLEYTAVSHRWPAFWDAGESRGIKRLLKKTAGRLLRPWIDPYMPTTPPQPNLDRAFFASRALRQAHVEAGWQCENHPVIYHGVDTGLFAPLCARRQQERRKLLVSGRIVPEKGIHLAVEALAVLAREGFKRDLSLDIVGPQPDPDYVLLIREMIHRHDLEGVVHLHSQVLREIDAGDLSESRHIDLSFSLGRAIFTDHAGSHGVRHRGSRHKHRRQQRNIGA